ncbi:MAG: hypothetical protein V2A67_08420 [Bacteroidota bacterium]
METISGNNYEIWFMDYLDGRLDEGKVDQLLDFLDNHPDLKEELNGVAGCKLVMVTDECPAKSGLLKNAEDIPGISTDDQLCIARMEKDLSPESAAAFDKRMEHEPGLRRKFDAYCSTRLNQEIIPYPDKNELKHKIRVLTPWILTAVCSAAILVLALILWPRTGENIVNVADTNIKPAVQQPQRVEVPVVRESDAPAQLIAAVERKKVPATEKGDLQAADSPVREFIPMNALIPVFSTFRISIPDPLKTPVLFASIYPKPYISTLPDEEYLSIPQYALQIFREKVLGQDPMLVKKTRFSVWEVAGAGISRINEMTGSEMKFDRAYDTNGQVMAVSFSSRLVDLETPVRTPGNKQE